MIVLQHTPQGPPDGEDPYAGGAVVRLTRYEKHFIMTCPNLFPVEDEPLVVPKPEGGKQPAGLAAGTGGAW